MYNNCIKHGGCYTNLSTSLSLPLSPEVMLPVDPSAEEVSNCSRRGIPLSPPMTSVYGVYNHTVAILHVHCVSHTMFSWCKLATQTVDLEGHNG